MDQQTIETQCDSLHKILLEYKKNDIDPELMKELKSNSKIVILFGVTGVGKTTLLNFLRGAEMNCIDKITHTEIELTNRLENEKYKIGHQMKQSQTLKAVHTKIQFQDQSIILIDTPGYGGTKQKLFQSEEQQWLDSLILKKLFKRCTNCCFLLIMTEEQINEKSQLEIDKFFEFLKQLTGIGEEKELLKMIRIVFNKTDREYQQQQYLEALQDRINKEKDEEWRFCLGQYLQILQQGFVQVQKQRQNGEFQTLEKRIEILNLILNMKSCRINVQHPFQNQNLLDSILIIITCTIKKLIYKITASKEFGVFQVQLKNKVSLENQHLILL